MFRITPATRLALSMGLIASALLWVAMGLRLLPNPSLDKFKHRVDVARYISVTTAAYAGSQRNHELAASLDRFVKYDPMLLSIGVRRESGTLIAVAGAHEEQWQDSHQRDQLSAELLANNRAYGTLEMVFAPVHAPGWLGWLAFPFWLTVYLSASLTLLSLFIFSRTFKYLNPSQVVPGRVRSALDTMAEGLVLLDPNGDIAHANAAFNRIVTAESETLLGRSIDSFQWTQSSDFGGVKYPWAQCLLELQPVCGVVIDLALSDQPNRKFMVNASPILSESGGCRGVLVSFDDVTAMESKKHELSQMIQTLRRSRDEVERKNAQLKQLASYDQLTGCLNRHEFFKEFESLWEDDSVEELCLLMLDIDHFKAVNDAHGHGAGDEVLRGIGKLLQDCVGEAGTVVRMGGEEFTILLPSVNITAGAGAAEEIVQKVRETDLAGLTVTMSIGVSTRAMKAMDPQHLLDQSDEALYAAKNNGRNRVIRYDEIESVRNSEASDLNSLAEDVEELVGLGRESVKSISPKRSLPDQPV